MDHDGYMWGYAPNGSGGLEPRRLVDEYWHFARYITQADRDADGFADGIWHVTESGDLCSLMEDGETQVGHGYNIYDRMLSVGNLGGAGADDLLACDKDGTLFLYLGYSDGRVTNRYRVGGGWNSYRLMF